MSFDSAVLKTAVPYIRAFKNKIFVVKVSGALCAEPESLDNICQQLALLYQLGIKLVVVHGGGPQATQLAQRMGVSSQQIGGRRVTDAAMLEVAKMAFAGQISTDFSATCKRFGIPALGLSGVDAGIIGARKRAPQLDSASGKSIDYGLVGDIDSINVQSINHLLSGELVPVIASLAADEKGQVLNINADTIAARLAVALGAAKLCVMTSVDGVLRNVNDRSTLISTLHPSDINMLKADGVIQGGMLPKVDACVEAVNNGVPRAHIVNGHVEDSLLKELFTNEGSGTLVVCQN